MKWCSMAGYGGRMGGTVSLRGYLVTSGNIQGSHNWPEVRGGVLLTSTR